VNAAGPSARPASGGAEQLVSTTSKAMSAATGVARLRESGMSSPMTMTPRLRRRMLWINLRNANIDL